MIKSLNVEAFDIYQAHGVYLVATREDDTTFRLPVVWSEQDFYINDSKGCSKLVQNLIENAINSLMFMMELNEGDEGENLPSPEAGV